MADLEKGFTDIAEASSVWQNLGGFKRNRRNSKELNEDELREAFNKIDKDGSGSIDREELEEALNKEMEAEGKKLTADQIDQLMNFADADGNGEIDFDEYKTIIQASSGVPKKTGAAAADAEASAPA